MQCVTAVDGHWLAELGPMFFSVKQSDKTVASKGKAREHMQVNFKLFLIWSSLSRISLKYY